MRRLNRVFLAVVLVAAAVGGATAVQFRNDLGAVSTVLAVEDRVEVRVMDAAPTEDGLTVTARLRNPTGYSFRVTGGGVVSAHNGTGEAIASGAGQRVDDGGDVLAAKGSLTVRYSARATPAQQRWVATAFEAGTVSVTVRVPLYYGDTRFTATGTGTVGGGDA